MAASDKNVDTGGTVKYVHQPMPDRAQISVVVVSYNTKKLLLECIASVLENRHAIRIEIIVVDNASADGSVDALRQLFPELSIIENNSNRGFAAACNQGIRESTGEFVLLLNSDARIRAGALEALIECMSNKRCGAAGCKVTSENGGESTVTMNFLTAFNQAIELSGIGKLMPWKAAQRTHLIDSPGETIDCSVDWIEASCLLVRRAALDETGLLDERFFMYSEDEDLCFRLRANGWQVCFTKSGSVVHIGGASSAGNEERMLVQFYLSQMRFLLKHRGTLSVEAYVLLSEAVLALKRVFRILIGASARAESLARRIEALRHAEGLFEQLAHGG